MNLKKLNNLLLCTSMLILPNLSLANTDAHQPYSFPKNSFYPELLGNGGLYSLNYERFLEPDLSIRLGTSYSQLHKKSSVRDSYLRFYSFPLMINFFHGSQQSSHKFETGVGLTWVIFKRKVSNKYSFPFLTSFDNQKVLITGPIPTASIGYRYVPKNSGMTFKASFTPFLFIPYYITPSVGIGLGYNF